MPRPASHDSVRSHRRIRPRAFGQSLPSGRRSRTAGLLVLLLLALAGCQIDQNAVKQDPFLQELVTAQRASQGKASQPHRLGEPFQVDNTQWTIQATDAAYALKLGATTVTAQGEFVVVRFVFENLSDSAQPSQPDMLVLQNGSGQRARPYQADRSVTALYAAWMHQQDFLTATLQPNVEYPLTLVFDVTRGASQLTLQFHSYPVQDQSQPML